MTTNVKNLVYTKTLTQTVVNVTDDCIIIGWNTNQTWNSQQNLISQDIVDAIGLVRSTILIPILFLIGFPGNVINMVVFFKQGLRERINLCLFSLALVDIIFVIFLFIFNADRMRGYITNDEFGNLRLLVYMIDKNVLGLYGFSSASLFISTIISTERCVCVLFPLRAQRCIPTKVIGSMVVISVCVIGFVRFAATAKFRVGCFYEIHTGKSVWQTTLSEYYFQNKEMVDALDGIFYGFCFRLGCPLIVCITTIITAVKLREIKRWRHRSSSSMSDKETAVTKMLIWLSVEFLILCLPNIFLLVSPMFDSQLNFGGQYENVYEVLVISGDLCSYSNCAVNCFVYYFTGSKYRETLHRLFGIRASSLHAKGNKHVIKQQLK